MSPRSAAQNQVMRDESRARIIDAALRLFSANGYEATSVRMIAAEAGVAQGLMYSHFKSKEELLQAIFQCSIQDVFESFALAETIGEGSQVERLIRAAFKVLHEKRDFWRLSYGVRMQQSVLRVLGDDLFDWITAIRARLERYFTEMGAADPAIEAEILFATIDGLAQHYILDAERIRIDIIVEALAARYRR